MATHNSSNKTTSTKEHSKPTVFISYSHKDERWKDLMVTHLKVLEMENILDVWDDQRISIGDPWEEQIENAIDSAQIAILMISANFLTSKFILRKEVGRFLQRHIDRGLRIFPVIVEPCAWHKVSWLAKLQARPKDGKPLSSGNDYEINANLALITEEITDIIKSITPISVDGPFPQLGPEKISLSKLPSTPSFLSGRSSELKMLDHAWESKTVNIVSLIAWGGVGKTALVNKWIRDMAEAQFKGARYVYGWSFYSQGAAEGRQVSADLFIALTLKWFGDPNPEEGSPWEKGERLANLIRERRTLLILDGLEPLQYPPGEQQGRLRDPGLKSLLRSLALNNPGLCVITSRLPVDDLKNFSKPEVITKDLENLAPEAGANLLNHLGVRGDKSELLNASREFEGHALALALLGRYLFIVFGGDIRQKDKISRLIYKDKQGAHARRVMDSYERWFEGRPEQNILRIMGLFDRPVDQGAIDSLIEEPVITGLTENLRGLNREDWMFALNNLKEARLLAVEDRPEVFPLDCHPLIREHFGEKLAENNPKAWTEAHRRLYEFYKSEADEFPNTIEELTPLYAAALHGCQAGLYQETHDDVLYRRIQRGDTYFSTYQLGAFGSDLAAFAGFFRSPWDELAQEITLETKANVTKQAGYCLRALGRLREATVTLDQSQELYMELEEWGYAADAAALLSRIYLIRGDLTNALSFAEQAVKEANLSKDLFRRVAKNAILADVLHQMGETEKAYGIFLETEELQRRLEPQFPSLHAMQGYYFADLLLSQGRYQEVQERTQNAIKRDEQDKRIIHIAANKLGLGMASLLEVEVNGKEKSAIDKAKSQLEVAVDDLRRARYEEYLCNGLLVRAKLYRIIGNLEVSKRDVDEVVSIANRSEMDLFLADAYIENSQLYLAKKDAKTAQHYFEMAKEMIESMQYYRRKNDIWKLEKQFNS